MAINPWYLASFLGHPLLWAALAILAAAFWFLGGKKDKWPLLFLVLVFASMLVAWGVNQGIKELVQAPRTCVVCPVEGCNPYCDEGFSFPSGHTARAFAGFTGLFLLLGLITKKWLKHAWIFLFPVLVALSRVFLGVHSYLDVLAGGLIGIAVAVLVYLVVGKKFTA